MAISLASLTGGGGANDFFLTVGTTGNTTYVLDHKYTSGRYEILFANSDTTYDIYVIAKDGSYAGHSDGVLLEASANFYEVVVLGAAASEVIYFTYKGKETEPSGVGDIAGAGAFVSGVVTSSLPSLDDSTVVNGGNFASDVEVSFIDQSDVEVVAKNVVRSSSTQLVVTRPDAFSPDDSPYTVKVVNPGIPVPSGSSAYLLVDSVTAGTNPVWQTTGDLFYNIGAATPDITLLATDSEGTDTDYSVVSGTLPAGLTLDGETGVISGTFSGSAIDGETNSVTFKATDAGNNFLNKTFNFIANAKPVWTTASDGVANPLKDLSYSFQFVASGGSVGGGLSYTLQSGSFNTGLSVSTSGEVSGTNTDASGVVATFTIRVTDEAGLFAEREFTTTAIAPEADFLVVAGGGGAGAAYGGGAGGGGYRTSAGTSGGGASAESNITIESSINYLVTVGGGGGTDRFNASNGSVSVFATITSAGGGRGGGGNNRWSPLSGGSGGGQAGFEPNGGAAGGTAGQGYGGGGRGGFNIFSAGGGGGAGGSGGNGQSNRVGGSGGAGVSSSISGTSFGRSGGGGGGGFSSETGYQGGAASDGGGRGANPGSTSNGFSGGANRGGGGGGGGRGSSTDVGGNGGSGIVILRYPESFTITIDAGLTASTAIDSGFKVTTFTAGTGNVSFI